MKKTNIIIVACIALAVLIVTAYYGKKSNDYNSIQQKVELVSEEETNLMSMTFERGRLEELEQLYRYSYDTDNYNKNKKRYFKLVNPFVKTKVLYQLTTDYKDTHIEEVGTLEEIKALKCQRYAEIQAQIDALKDLNKPCHE